MSERKRISLRRMPPGGSGKVVEIQGGVGMINRLSALGLRPGKKITKVSSMLMRGPITVQLGNTRFAIGFGMAGHIVVEMD
jgi:ferrous iron transport protein A